MNIGKGIKSIRKQNGLTQIEFAEKLGVKNNHISRIEIGTRKPSFELLELIATVFNIKWSKIFWKMENKSDFKNIDATTAKKEIEALIPKANCSNLLLSVAETALKEYYDLDTNCIDITIKKGEIILKLTKGKYSSLSKHIIKD